VSKIEEARDHLQGNIVGLIHSDSPVDLDRLVDALIFAVREEVTRLTRFCDNYKCKDGTQEIVWFCPHCGNVAPATEANMRNEAKK
jgi:hypothetical protein